MVDDLSWNMVAHWAIFGAIGLMAILLNVLPLGDGAPGWPAPDWLLVLGSAWVIRRPEFVPLALFAGLALLADFILVRPPGLYALLSVAVIEFLRSRTHAAREWPFAVEWGMFAVLTLALVLANRFAHMIFVIPQARFGLEMQQYLSTIIAYPILLGLSVWLFGVARPKPGDRGGQT